MKVWKKDQIHADIISSPYKFAPLLGVNNLVLSWNPEIFCVELNFELNLFDRGGAAIGTFPLVIFGADLVWPLSLCFFFLSISGARFIGILKAREGRERPKLPWLVRSGPPGPYYTGP